MRLVVYAVALVFLGLAAHRVQAEDLPVITVWKSPSCGCCTAWVEHVEASGFEVDVQETDDIVLIKKMAGVPEDLWSCHTARVDGYLIEGHVPASDIKKLLVERPRARGLVVPGMPSGSPGMENGMQDAYDVLLLGEDDKTEPFSSYQ